MTAIAGLWSFGGGQDRRRACAAMLSALDPYGPDGRDQKQLGALDAGRNLFSLLPEDVHDKGVLIGRGGTCLLAADLRIDNRDELAAALGIGKPDLARLSDAGLLLAGLERWREEVLDRLVGDFAFAWYDEPARTLILARDLIGQRPLFWHRGRDFFAFASMPSGLHALPEVPNAPDLDSAARFAALLPLASEASHYSAIMRVMPGYLLTVTPEGEVSRPFWRPPAKDLALGSFDNYVEAYRETLDRAVASRLRGAGDLIAAHLSGGWDSSAVTATAARLLRNGAGNVIAYTSVPGDEQPQTALRGRFTDEAPLAAATASLYPNIRHVLVRNPNNSPVDYLDRTVALFQRPPFNLCNHDWLAAIREQARAVGARVLLTGEIGNWTISSAPSSLLADYVRQGRWGAWGSEARAMLGQRRARMRGVLASSFAPWLPTALWRAASGWSSASELELALQPAWRERLGPALNRQRFGPESRPRDYRARSAAGLAGLDYGQHRKGILAGWGIDKRDATADRRLIDFTLALPLDMLMSGGQRRPLARAALSDRVPEAVLDERGKGLQAPDWHVALTRHRSDLYRLVDQIEADARAHSVIDTALLRRWLDALPSAGWERPDVIARYRSSLLFTLSAGHFIAATPA